jgi:hypothetical protein
VLELMALTIPPCGHIMMLELLSRLAIAIAVAPRTIRALRNAVR